jgi:hypothetical protein
MISWGKRKKMATGILAVILVLFLFAPTGFIAFLLKTLTYHPWRLCFSVAISVGLYAWVMHEAYFGSTPEKPGSEPIQKV